ncbi:MAG: aspartyl-tRNA(Asn)/glutamyl-tRNA(Gln) amidotransferase subunit [Microbacteriaceae bacterium]|jgi:aspartyl-tRNA(Asn)/glutamyl-tRNA(Gln) amidotransferase subunit A|nr:aspartyl-tRNA(Asn)/glutamyl-tRNA(Gln) amidotransferase subunit [Microbacteriaceae bacterium]
MNVAEAVGLQEFDQIRAHAELGGAAVTRLSRSVGKIPHATSLNAITSLDVERAYAEARRLDRLEESGNPRGPLHGVPILVKDNIDVAGLPTTNGSAANDGLPAQSDAIVIRRLRRAGALIIGKTNMDELALGVTGANSRYPRTLNAWDQHRLPGGSSGGSAVALAAGAAEGALGTDTGGSVRTPAAFNGVTALRPTSGLISLEGVTPLSPRFDTVGPMGRDIRTVERLLGVLSKPLRGQRTALTAYPHGDHDRPLRGLRIGIPEAHFFSSADPDVAAVVMTAANQFVTLGATLVDVVLDGAERASATTSTMMLADGYSFHKDLVDADPRVIDPAVQERIELGRDVTVSEYRDALDWMSTWSDRVTATFESADLLLVPTTPMVAPRIGEDDRELDTVRRVTQFTFPWSLACVPALQLPCGLASDMPVGMQLVSPRGSDVSLLRVAALYERETLWNDAFHTLNAHLFPGAASDFEGSSS